MNSENNNNKTLSLYECFSNVQQEFLVCVTIHKARNLSSFNVNTYVKVTLDKKSKCTKVFQNSENPYFNEYFVFELFCSLGDLKRSTVLFEVKKKSWYKKDICIGELLIDLTTVWNQSGHLFFKKWGKLENPFGTQSDVPRGYLQIDLTIVSRNGSPVPAVLESQDFEDIEMNLLQKDISPQEVKNVKYYITVYKGIFVKKSDYAVHVSFAGMIGKTNIKNLSNNPEWNQEFTINAVHPSLSQNFYIQVMAQRRCVADYEIHFDEIEFGDELPCLGPTYINLYDPLNSTLYIGRILIEIKCEIFKKELSQRLVTDKIVQPIFEETWWSDEEFSFECLIWQGDFIHHESSSNIKIQVKCGESSSNQLELVLLNYPKTSSLKYFSLEKPAQSLLLTLNFPDNRHKYEADHFISKFIKYFQEQLEDFKIFKLNHENPVDQAKQMKSLISNLKSAYHENHGANRFQYNGFKTVTCWDQNRMKHLNEYFEKLMKILENFRKKVKNHQNQIDEILNELYLKINELKILISSRIQDVWPDLILMLMSGTKEIAVCKLNVKDFIYSQRKECRGQLSGIRNHFIFKTLSCKHTCKNCGCIYSKFEGWILISTDVERDGYQLQDNLWESLKLPYYTIRMETNFNCNIYIHQAKIRPGYDTSGLCDARIRVVFLDLIKETSTVLKSLSPIWDEVISFKGIQLAGTVEWYFKNPIMVALEMFDEDSNKIFSYMGCGVIEPVVQSLKKYAKYNKNLDSKEKSRNSRRRSPPTLKWVEISSNGSTVAEVLMFCELIELESSLNAEGGEGITAKSITLQKNLPMEICPIMKRYKVEVTFAGLRDCGKLSEWRVYKIKVLFGNLSLLSGSSGEKLDNSYNFLEIYAAGVVSLPEQIEYWPPIIVTHLDCSRKNQEVVIGAALISSPGKYLVKDLAVCDEIDENQEHIVVVPISGQSNSKKNIERTPLLQNKSNRNDFFPKLVNFSKNIFTNPKSSSTHTKSKSDESEYTWWTKFYYTMHKDSNCSGSIKHHLIIYGSELEKQPEFSYLQDWAKSVKLVKGIKRKPNEPAREESYCTLKCNFKIKCCEHRLVPHNAAISLKSLKNDLNIRYQELESLKIETKIIIRIYVVQGLHLRSQDMSRQSDAFVKIKLGSKTISDRANYVPNQSNPIFGKRYQLEASIPREHYLHISLFDRNCLCEDLIGTTTVDLEDRIRTKHRATVGIANEFSRSGYNIWRDMNLPSEILKEVCKKYDLSPPIFSKNKIQIAGIEFEDSTVIAKDEDSKERLSLTALKNFYKIPNVGYSFVPEHVETRSLYRTDRPGIEQGKLQLWIEIFSPEYIPYPIDITPVPAQQYELRVIVYNTADVKLDDKMFGTETVDIYVKGWMESIDLAQSTDIHYRSLTGSGNFNWRMIFSLKYSKVENMMIMKKEGHLFEDTLTKQPPIVTFQIWDSDTFSADDHLGSLEINLSHFLEPAESKGSCNLETKGKKYLNLFNQNSVKGWFPCKGKVIDQQVGMTGKIELELHVVTEQEALSNPVGLGRNPPKALPEPNRPKTSFNPLLNPLDSFKHILLPAIKKYCCYCILVIFFILIVLHFTENLFGSILSFPHFSDESDDDDGDDDEDDDEN